MHTGLQVEVFDHLAGVRHVGLDACIVHQAAGHRLDVADGLVGRVLSAQGGDAMVVGDPDAAAGNGRGAAVAVALLDQQDLQAEVVGAQRRGHRPSAGADHQHVATVVPGAIAFAHSLAPRVLVL
ncbi:hypothetical protein D3C86_1598950 [compost metagenome]